MKDIIEIVESLGNFGLLPEGISETIQNEAKEQKGGFLSMLLGTLGASLLGNILPGKGINRTGEGVIANRVSEETKLKRQGQGILRAGYWNKKGGIVTTKRQGVKKIGFLMPRYPLTNFEIQKYYQNKCRFNGVYSRDKLPRIRVGHM